MALQAAITILTINAGGWAPFKRLLPELCDDLIAEQEHRLAGASSATAAAALKATPWQTSWRDASITAAGGRSGGVALLARPWLDVGDISSRYSSMARHPLATRRGTRRRMTFFCHRPKRRTSSSQQLSRRSCRVEFTDPSGFASASGRTE